MADFKALIAEARDALKVEHDPNWLTLSELDARFAAFSAGGLVQRLTDAVELLSANPLRIYHRCKNCGAEDTWPVSGSEPEVRR